MMRQKLCFCGTTHFGGNASAHSQGFFGNGRRTRRLLLVKALRCHQIPGALHFRSALKSPFGKFYPPPFQHRRLSAGNFLCLLFFIIGLKKF